MKLNKIARFISGCLLILSITTGQAQDKRHNLYFNIGLAPGKADTRLDFMSEWDASYIKNSPNFNPTNDDEYFLNFSYRYNTSNRFHFGGHIGYSLLVNDMLLPANGQSFFKQQNELYYWKHESYYHIAQVTPTIGFSMIRKSSFQAGFSLDMVNNISFLKHIQPRNLSRTLLEYYSSELYPSVYFEFKKFNCEVGFRVLHRKYRDDAIANNGLDPDPYNPFKWRFGLGYKLF